MLRTKSSAKSAEHVPETAFYIPGTGASTRPRYSLKQGDCFAVIDSYGDIGAVADGSDGIFFYDTRYLSHLEIKLNGHQPLLLGSNVRDDNSIFTIDLTNPDIYREQKLVQPKDMLHVVRTLFLLHGTAYQRLCLTNHGDSPFDVRLSVEFDSDFADLFEVRGMRRQRRGSTRTEVQNTGVTLNHLGLDGVHRRTVVTFEPRPAQLSRNAASYAFTVQPHEFRSVYMAVRCESGTATGVVMPFQKALRKGFREYQTLSRAITRIASSNDIFNEIIGRSVADLAMLTTKTPQGPYPYAGIPWYSTTFGRDGIITAMQMLWCDPGIAKGVLRRLAALQAHETDPLADAEPGKILHEMRHGEMAALREVPFGLYYGSVDSTPLFVMLAGLYCGHTGDLETLRELWPNIEAALSWIDGPGDPDRDGFIEYNRADEQGLANQGWKDSQDAIFHADGSLAEGPIALCEVQGYVYAAKRLMARAARRLGHRARGDALDTEAVQLRDRFEAAFWCEDLGTYALALDGEKRPCRVHTSNAGQVLFSGIASPEHAQAVVRDLMRPVFFSGWGIRTVAREERRYNPMSYHNGSVWPHDNALIAAGFARYGYKSAVDRIFTGLFDAATYMNLRRLPELFCGFQRGHRRGPTLYPVACAPQAWAAGTPLLLLQSSLGLEFNPDRHEIRLRKPRLPPFVDELTLSNVRLGDSAVDLTLRKYGDDVSLQVLRNEGRVLVSTTY